LKSVFSETLAISLFVNFLALAVPVFTLQVYDRVVFHAGISTLKGLVIGMAIVLLFDFVLRQSRTRIMQTVALKVDVLVGRRLFNKVMALPLQTLESQPGAHWQALFRDVDMVRNTLSGASAVLLTDLPFVLLFLGLIYVIATPLFPILMVILPIFMIVAWRSGSVMANANKQERQSSMSRDGMIAEMVAGRTTIKALALDRAMRPIWEKKHAENIENSVLRGSKADSYTNLGTTLTLMTTISLTTFGAWFIINQEMTMGSLIATNMLSGRLLGPLNQLVGQWRTYNSFKQAVERLGQVFLAPSERQVSEISMGRPRGEITLETVTYTYLPDAAPVLDNVQLSIKAGGVHALVGRNGSGKTTLLKILQGLYKPSTGRVMLDGADIAQFTRAELADWIGYVPQESVLFEGSVRDNISHRRPDSDDAEIIRAATAAGVHHFIIDLPDGYATEIGEAGRRLSGGQRQRISVARALVGDPPVLLLDEPSSNLDRQAEHELRDTITELGRLHTVIVVTHSPILLAACNNLVALEKGKIALAGPAKEILPRLFGSRRGAKPQPGAEEEKKTGAPGGDGEPALQSRPWRAVKPRQPSPGEAADQVAPPAPDRADGSVEPNIERDAYIGETAPSTPAATTVVDATPKDEVPAENSTQKPFSVDQT
jgi:ATP-binding cassette subfamily C protein LapB